MKSKQNRLCLESTTDNLTRVTKLISKSNFLGRSLSGNGGFLESDSFVEKRNFVRGQLSIDVLEC